MPGIIVGVDGSDHSRRALRWAMREAAAHHAPLTVVAVHPPVARPATLIYWNVPEDLDTGPDLERARADVRVLVDKVASETGEPPADITVSVAVGDPAAELVRASRGADMLVVGSRGSGEFARLLVGSVASKVIHHAECPVAVIRGTS